ncbi:MAG TPA: enolase C-terminal domain-like protein [Thermomicrobiales bacterium]
MRIVEFRETTAPIASPMRNAYIDFSTMTVSVVAIVTDVVRDGRRVVGYGFNSNGRYAPAGLLRERFIPRLLEAEPASLCTDDGGNLDPQKIWATMMTGEKPGGHGERAVAVGTIDMAVWDAVAKIEGRPLYRVLADRYRGGQVDERVFVYAAGGYYAPGKDVAALREEIKGYRDLGYRVVKIKIGGASLAEDLRRIEAVLAVVGAGENLFSMPDARNLIRYGGMRPDRDVLQFDCALSYGLVEYLRTIAMLEEHGWSRRAVIPHGGHQMSLNMAAGLGLGGNESYPGVFQPFGGFADNVPVIDGHVGLPDSPGIGFEEKANLYPLMRALAA